MKLKMKQHDTLVAKAAKLAYSKYDEDLLTAEDAFIAGYAAAIASKNAEVKPSDIPDVEPPVMLSETFIGTSLQDHQGFTPEVKQRFQQRLKEEYSLGREVTNFLQHKPSLTSRITSPALCANIARTSPYQRSEVQDVLNLLLQEILDQVLQGHTIILDKFGSFSLKFNRPRLMKNPIFGNFVSKGSVNLKFDINRELRKYLTRHSKEILEHLREKEYEET